MIDDVIDVLIIDSIIDSDSRLCHCCSDIDILIIHDLIGVLLINFLIIDDIIDILIIGSMVDVFDNR